MIRTPVFSIFAACCLIATTWVAADRSTGLAAGDRIGAADASRSIRLRYQPRDRETGRYQYVPFDVPAGTRRLVIEYRYDRADGANVIDLGLFEPGSLDLGTNSFRGWSGGERASVSIAEDSATPGYRPGRLPAGRWHVLLGLYKVAQDGVGVEVTIATSPGAEDPTAPRSSPRQADVGPPDRLPRAPSSGPRRRGAAWYRGDLHIHTVHSDGALTVSEVTQVARTAGLDFIAITDHNNTTHQLEHTRDDDLLRIVGEEVTTPGGHANVWGLGPADWIDFRVRPEEDTIGALVAAADARGALFSINHPISPCVGCSWQHQIPAGVDGIEIWNGRHDPPAQAIGLWDRLLRDGRRLTGIGSSDWHRFPTPMGAASVAVYARELSTPAILEALAKGRVVVMADASLPIPQFTVRLQADTTDISRDGEDGSGGIRLQPPDIARGGEDSSGSVRPRPPDIARGEADGSGSVRLQPDRAWQVGDTVTVKAGEKIQLELSCEIDAGRVDAYWNGERIDGRPVGRGAPARFLLTAADSGYVRMQMYSADNRLLAITNPIYVTVKRSAGL